MDHTQLTEHYHGRTQRNDICQYKGLVVLFLEDTDLTKLGITNVDSAVLSPCDTIATLQARNSNLAPIVDMTVPH
jgi:hypothetical protein